MKTDLTDIIVILDRSGSMQTCKDDMEGGLNAFIESQKKQPGEAVVTLIEFDDKYDVVYEALPIGQVKPYALIPRGMTALFDAVGRTINSVGERLSAMPEDDRPGLVLVVIITDGEENASREFTKEKIREMITHQSEAYNWQFTYLGANQDAFAAGTGMGISTRSIASYYVQNTKGAWGAVSNYATRSRCCTAAGDSADNVSYSDKERYSMVSGKK